MTQSNGGQSRRWLALRQWRGRFSSFAGRMLALALVFAIVPVILYDHLETADSDRHTILLKAVQDQGRVVVTALRSTLDQFDGTAMPKLQAVLDNFASPQQRIRLLYRPTDKLGIQGFFYVAAVPKPQAEYLERERSELIDTGIFERLQDSCDDNRQVAVRYTNPDGEREVLTSVTPINARSGCWVVITASSSDAVLGSSLGQPYWKTPEIRIAAAIYAIMVVIVFSLFFGIRGSLRRFARLAQQTGNAGDVGRPGSFEAMNRMQELQSVAAEFDRMVDRLRSSAATIRNMAEENAHAFKTPIAVTVQALEPLRRLVAEKQEERSRRALEIIETSLAKLEGLVLVSQRMDEAIAETVNPPRHPVDLSGLVQRLVEGFAATAELRQVKIASTIAAGIVVPGSDEAIEVMVENILENAISFSPPDGTVWVSVDRHSGHARVMVEDEGPGIDLAHKERIFERYFSARPQAGQGHTDQASETIRAHREPHFGLGLWVVRRNAEALGGRVEAENRREGGCRMRVILPLL